MYYALAQSLLQYCLVAWGGAYANVITPLQRTQNILLRIILNKHRLFHTQSLYDLYKVPTIQDIYIQKLTYFTLKQSKNWTLNTNIYNTRRPNQVQTNRIHKTLTMRHFTYLGRRIYNLLPQSLTIQTQNFNNKITKKFVQQWLIEDQNKETICNLLKQ